MTVEECVEDYDSVDSEEDEFDRHETVYFKYEFEGLSNIDDIIKRLNELKEMFEYFKEQGCELLEPVDTGYCFIKKP